MFDQLRARGFDIAIRNHAGAILSVDFPEIANELVSALLSVSIPAEELVAFRRARWQAARRARWSAALHRDEPPFPTSSVCLP